MVTKEQWLELHKLCLDAVRWERAVDFITDLFLVGPQAKPRSD